MARRRRSAGLLVWRRRGGALEVLLVHPGGPFWRRKDAGAWSIPKGEVDEHEDALAAARREFVEETGAAVDGPFAPLPPCRLASGKVVEAFAVEADLDVARMHSNTFELEWPPRSGRTASFPEVDRHGYFTLDDAALKLGLGQRALLAALRVVVDGA